MNARTTLTYRPLEDSNAARRAGQVREILERNGGLVSASDLARVWDISKTRLTVLTHRESFPEPVATVGGRPVWLADEAQQWRDKQLKDA